MALDPALPRSLNEWVVLALIDESPRHGFSIARELKQGGTIGEAWTVARPLVYRAIDHLESIGLIVPTSTEPGEKGAVRTVYSTTQGGRESVARWLARPIAHPRDVRTDLVAKFVLLARRGLDVAALAGAQLESFRPTILGLEEKASHATAEERVVAIWRVESMRAITRFLEAVADAGARAT